MRSVRAAVSMLSATTPQLRRSVVRQTVAGTIAVVLAAGTVLGGQTISASGALPPTLAQHSFIVSAGAPAYTLDYWSNGEIGIVDPTVRRVVVMVHGDSRNADDYGRYTSLAADAAGLADSTMVVAPLFIADVDFPRADQLYWTEDSWKRGGESENSGRSWAMSSFRVMDALLAALRSDYPKARLVLAGHSAGGQFVQRYAASSTVHLANRYVPMNPGSYLYLDRRRWFKGRLRAPTPKELKTCTRYNTYRYGLKRRPAGEFAADAATVVSTYLGSRVTYLLGKADRVRDSDLDTSCSADWEGPNRFRRGTRFFAALQVIAGSRLRHHMVIVPGVAHEGGSMIRSTQAAPVLFGSGSGSTGRRVAQQPTAD
jgi:pimeloyl-ACP methyl ester carboxylesterase